MSFNLCFKILDVWAEPFRKRYYLRLNKSDTLDFDGQLSETQDALLLSFKWMLFLI